MKTRLATLTSRKAFSATDVIERDIRGSDPISFIDIGVRMTNGATMLENAVVKVHDDVTKIELVDGGDVLISANMEELQALNAFERKNMPRMEITWEDDAVQEEWVRIPFGFYGFDPNHYLRPADFGNLQLKVSITLTTVASGTWAASGHDVTMIAGIMERGYGDYKGFLSTKNVKAYSAVDGAREDIQLNTDWPYRAILLQAFKTATRPDENLELIRLTADDDKHVALELYATELEAQNAYDFGRFTQKYQRRLTGTIAMLCDFYLNVNAYMSGGTSLTATKVGICTAESLILEEMFQT